MTADITTYLKYANLPIAARMDAAMRVKRFAGLGQKIHQT